MNAPVTAKDIMVTRLRTLSPGMDVCEAIGLLLNYKISGAPVVDENNNFIGVFSERSSMSVIVQAAYDQLPTSVIDPFVDTKARTIDEETDMLTIAQIFNESGARRLPVLRGTELIGQISRRDLLKAAHDLIAVAPCRETALLYLSSLVDRENAPIV